MQRHWHSLRGAVPLHIGVAVGMVVFGVGVLLNPDFPFRGDLFALHPLAPRAYALGFIAGGAGLLCRRPSPLAYWLLTAPLFLHLVGNIVDIALTALPTLTPILALYGVLLFALVKDYE